jgi:hypothetical protein
MDYSNILSGVSPAAQDATSVNLPMNPMQPIPQRNKPLIGPPLGDGIPAMDMNNGAPTSSDEIMVIANGVQSILKEYALPEGRIYGDKDALIAALASGLAQFQSNGLYKEALAGKSMKG